MNHIPFTLFINFEHNV